MLSILLAGALVAAPSPAPRPPVGPAAAAPLISRTAFHDGMRQLWEDHVIWTRLYDEVHRQILQMADVLSEGIIKQFPGRFS
jgi:hypothetical protein